MANDKRLGRRPPLVVRVVWARRRLFGSAVLGAVVTAVLSAVTTWRPATRWLVGWDLGVGIYLLAAYYTMARADIASIRRRAAEQDEGQLLILVLTVGAAMISLAAIVALLGKANGSGDSRQTSDLVLAGLTILLSWAFIHTIFALHYAHEFYDEDISGGLAFPGGEPEPDYWDFVYFSFVIGMTSQVSDVGITNRQIRCTAAAHGVVSFVFNAALLALTVNIAASAI